MTYILTKRRPVMQRSHVNLSHRRNGGPYWFNQSDTDAMDAIRSLDVGCGLYSKILNKMFA